MCFLRLCGRQKIGFIAVREGHDGTGYGDEIKSDFLPEKPTPETMPNGGKPNGTDESVPYENPMDIK